MEKAKSVSIAPRFGFLYRIGRCPKCMREAFLFAAASNCLALTALVPVQVIGTGTNFWTAWTYLAWLLAGASTALWLTHIAVKAWNTAQLASVEGSAGVTRLRGRRDFLVALFRGLGTAALITVLPKSAFAWNECAGRLTCGYSDCARRTGSEVYCCPKGYPILSLCNCRCYQSVQGMQCNSTGSCFDQNF